MNVLMYHRAAAVSGPRLAQWMGLHSTRSLDGERNRPTTLIRYGTSKRIPLRPSQLTLNTAASLSRYSNRGQQLRILRDGGVPVPPFTTRDGLETMTRQGGLPLLARHYPRNRQPTRGQGITFVPPGEAPPEDFDLLLQFIPKDRQFRVHVIGGRTRVREVIPTEPGLREQPVWNLGEGFIYNIPQTPPPPSTRPQQWPPCVSTSAQWTSSPEATLPGYSKSIPLPASAIPRWSGTALSWADSSDCPPTTCLVGMQFPLLTTEVHSHEADQRASPHSR